jgi:hypothetical protein
VSLIYAKEIQSKKCYDVPSYSGPIDNRHYDWQHQIMIAIEAFIIIVVMAILMVLMVIAIRDVLRNLFCVV